MRFLLLIITVGGILFFVRYYSFGPLRDVADSLLSLLFFIIAGSIVYFIKEFINDWWEDRRREKLFKSN
ncbi:MAG: hypothetical protein M1338_00850 [Patescibacteria group bacterium]|nr:hypothetical protein [Patescibacteria group bacterium]